MITIVIMAIAIASFLLGMWVGCLITKDDTYDTKSNYRYRESNNMYNRQRNDMYFNNPIMEQFRKDRAQQPQASRVFDNKKY